MAKQSHLTCSVITPERQVLETEATAVVIPAHDGLIGILRDRAPLLCELGQGVLRVDSVKQGQISVNIAGGFAQVLNNNVIVLTEKADMPPIAAGETVSTAR